MTLWLVVAPTMAFAAQPGWNRWELPNPELPWVLGPDGLPSNPEAVQASTPGVPAAATAGGSELPAPAAAGVQTSTSTEITTEILALARALKNDVDLIYEYVYNEIEFVPIYGSNKGAMGALLDEQGNSFDQASLMISLLRASGYSTGTAQFAYGSVRLYPTQLNGWIGVDLPDLDWEYFNDLFLQSGYWSSTTRVWHYANGPGSEDDTLAYADIDHVWVRVLIGGTWYHFDPSLKSHIVTPAIADLASVMGYSPSTFLDSVSGPSSGATVASDYVQDLNTSNLEDALTAYAGNLVSHIRANLSGGNVQDVIGGKRIDKIDATATPLRVTSHPNQNPTNTPVFWADVGSSFRTSVRVEHQGIDTTFYSDSLGGKRLTIFYDDETGQPELRLDGTVIDTGNATPPGFHSLTFTVDHPYLANGGTFIDNAHTMEIEAGGGYLIMNGWSETGPGSVEHHRKRQQANAHAGGASNSEEVLGEILAAISSSWLAQFSGTRQLSDKLQGVVTHHHHTLGVAAQTASLFVDIPLVDLSHSSRIEDEAKKPGGFLNVMGHSSAIEWAVIEQTQPFHAVSTVKLFDTANGQSDKIFEATSSNYWGGSGIRSQLYNYSSSDLAKVDEQIWEGCRVLLPERGDLNETDWSGSSYLSMDCNSGGVTYGISGGLNGGLGASEGWAILPDSFTLAFQNVSNWIADPIDLVTGDFLYEETDLTIGSTGAPLGLAFRRSYNSAARFEERSLGLGWSHNFDIEALLASDAFQALGADSPVDAASAIVEQWVSLDLLSGTPDKLETIVATLAQRWYMEQMIDNVVIVRRPGSSARFVQLADGSYQPSPGAADALSVQPDGSYRVTTKHGAVTDFDTDGKVETWSDANGNTLTFDYSGDELQTLSNGSGRTLTFSYTGGRLSAVSDGTGRSYGYGYDGAGNLTTITDVHSEDSTFEYAADGLLARAYRPADPLAPIVDNVYDGVDKVATQVDPMGNTYHYYFSGSRSEEENPLGDSKIWYHDSRGRTARAIDALGNETISEFDGENRLIERTFPEGNRLTYEYDAFHNRTKQTHHPKSGSAEPPIVSSSTYEPAFQRVSAETDPRGNTTSFFYDAGGNLKRIEQPEIGGQTPTTRMTYDSRGQLLSMTDPTNRVSSHTYDPVTADLLSTTVDPGGLALTSTTTYDAVGNVETQTDPKGHTTSYRFDGMRRLTKVEAPEPLADETEYVHDENGRVVETRRRTGAGKPPQVTSIRYTLSGRTDTATDPESNDTVHEYDTMDRLWRVTDAEQRVTRFLYDERGDLYQVIDATGVTAEEHLYTANGREDSFRDANGQLMDYGYDDFDRRNRIDYPDASFEFIEHDAASNPTEKQTRAGETIHFVYDELNRLDTRTLPGSIVTSYGYDLAGRLDAATNPTGTLSQSYDAAGRVQTATSPGARTLAYEYDANSNRSRLTYPDGYFVTYVHDPLNRLREVFESGVVRLADYRYDGLSQRTQASYANGTSTGYAYEADGDLKSVVHQWNGRSVRFDYTYDAVHNRLTRSTNDAEFTYSLQASSQPTYVPNAVNQYSSVGGIARTHDANGNLNSDGSHSYTHDAENRLVGAAMPGPVSASYAYDAFGRRANKIVEGTSTHYLYDGDRVIAEYDGSGTRLRRYVYGPGIDEPIRMTTASASYTYHFDAQGSVVALTDGGGALAESYTYTPFGETTGASALGNPYRYTGRRHDGETGLYYYRARHYSATSGRFLEVDPIGHAGGFNLYAYVHNNPLRWGDPMGLAAASGGTHRQQELTSKSAFRRASSAGIRKGAFAAATLKAFGVVGVTVDLDILSYTSDVVNPENEKFTSGIEVAVEAFGLPLGFRFLRREINASGVASPFDIFDQPARYLEPILPVTISEGGMSVSPDFGRGRFSIGAGVAPTVGFDFQEFFREDPP